MSSVHTQADSAGTGEGAQPLVLSVPEAARLLGISRTLAYELVARGELPAMRFGRRVVVPRRRLLLLIEPETADPTS